VSRPAGHSASVRGISSYPPERLHDDFGADVAALVAGLTRLDDQRDVATVDREILLLKLADRLHNMRTIKYRDRRAEAAAPETH
jgi:guanosine-3',5'-bis(diphosphate) 3'-pyrophosphohydrolase